ncbi:hypothetical protein D3C72_2165150 [compost metagenome]
MAVIVDHITAINHCILKVGDDLGEGGFRRKGRDVVLRSGKLGAEQQGRRGENCGCQQAHAISSQKSDLRKQLSPSCRNMQKKIYVWSYGRNDT